MTDLIIRATLIQSELETFITEFSKTEAGQNLSVEDMKLLYLMVLVKEMKV